MVELVPLEEVEQLLDEIINGSEKPKRRNQRKEA